ncbi:hypothetical protein SASPL_126474 [Salvia splendens]|uniref:Uridine kinase n=1 Tax=Salvia splendens TaxID=180675 RepID=A0A8X8XFP9_SALSN|nr:hypothetical protein SASPL_126474 [Salvia splendens]
MAQDTLPSADSPRRRSGLLRDQVQLIKRKDTDRFEIAPIQDPLAFEKGFFVFVRACQLLAQKNEGMVLVGVAGPSGAGKTVFTEKILTFMPSIAVINMDNYNDASRIIDGNFDDPRLTDYDTLLENIHGLKSGSSVQIPIYDFKSSSRVGYRTLEVPSSRIVIIEGIYALSEKLRPLLDLRVSVTGGVHFDLVKRVLRDIQRAGQEPEEIIHQISETSTRPVTVDQIKAVFSDDYKESTEETYDIYLLPPGEDPEACQSYLRMRNRDGKYNLMFECKNSLFHLGYNNFDSDGIAMSIHDTDSLSLSTYEVFQSQSLLLFMVSKHMMEALLGPEWVTDSPFIISPRITFEVSVRLLGGLMALGYTIASILKRSSHVFSSDKVCVKTDWLEQLNRKYIQVQGKDRMYVKFIAKELGLDSSYIPRTYIEQIQLEKLINDVMALPDDLKTKLSIDDDLVSSPKEALSRASADRRMKFMNRGISQSYTTNRDRNLSKLTKLAVNNRRYDGRTPDSPAALANQGIVTQLSEQISTLNERMDEFTSRIEELNSKVSIRKVSASQQNLALQADGCSAVAPSSLLGAGVGNGLMSGSHLPNSSSSSQLARESAFMEEVLLISRGQRQIMLQIDNLSSMLHEFYGERSHQGRTDGISDLGSIGIPLLLSLAVGGVGILLLKTISAKT